MKILQNLKERKENKKQIKKCNGELTKQQNEMEELNKKLPYLKGQVTRARKGTGKKTVAEAEQALTSAQSRISELERLIKENTAKIDGLQVDLDALKISNILKENISKIKINRTEKIRIKEQLSTKKNRLQELEDEYGQNQTPEKLEAINSLKAVIQSLEEELKKFSFIAKIANLVNKKSNLRKEINDKKVTLNNYIQNQTKLKNDVAVKKAQLTRVKNGTSKKKSLDEAENELEEAKNAYSDNETAIENLKDEIEKLEKQLAGSTPKIPKKSIIVTIVMVVILVVLILVFGIVVRSCSHPTDSYIPKQQPSTMETTEASTMATEIVTEELTEPTEYATEDTTEEPTEQNLDSLKNSNSVAANNQISTPSNNSSNTSSSSDSSYEDYYEVVEDSEQNKSEDMNSSKDSNNDEGISGGNAGYGASISGDKEAPVPEQIFEEKNPLPPAVTQEQIDNAPIINLTPAN